MRPRLVPELVTTDLDRSLGFYRDVLGFRVLYARPEERFAYLDRNGAELMLEQPHRHDRLWPRARLDYPFGRGVNFEIHVDDVDALHAAVAKAGIELFLPLEERW
jgi:catechol 2,3-dioxygenase-like lactoylglutathione lyase family enzyme